MQILAQNSLAKVNYSALRRLIYLAPILLFASLLLHAASPTDQISRLAKLMGWKSGDVIADIGAGDGGYTFASLTHLGTDGKVYATELDKAKLASLKKEASIRGLKNLEVLEAHEKDTNLPPNCCDAIFLRRVYHHLTAPNEMDASLLRSLKPGGKLAIIDFPPRPELTRSDPVEGVPKNRGGHGIPQKVLIDELTSAGFAVDQIIDDWPEDDYCVIFGKAASR
jgi:ubiquinone/menaquinone biosynthesis C-methylase UbiE